MRKKEYSVEVGGRELVAEFNDLANQANGSVLMRYGNTSVLITAVMEKQKNDTGFLPLSVDYEEKFYAAGRILGSRFVRREGKPSEEAVLSGRLVDRTIRPLFDKNIREPIQIVVTVLSIGEEDPDILAIIGTSLALSVSDIPWSGPVSAVRVGSSGNDDELTVNPTYSFRNDQRTKSDTVVCGKDGKVIMLESGADEIGEQKLESEIRRSLEEIGRLQEWQEGIIKKEEVKKRIVEKTKTSKEIVSLYEKRLLPLEEKYVFSGKPGKESIDDFKNEWKKVLEENLPEADVEASMQYFEERVDRAIHEGAIEKNCRPDGRGMDEVRPLYAQAGGLSKIHHGAGIFYRGETHILSVLTLGGPSDSQIIEEMEGQDKKHFLHHYNFPPFSVGETGRIGGANRRMIGHGALAEKALRPVIPSKDDFPYTIRIVSEALASNGSTSMGSVCASTLALMDGGVPIKKPVAGIASGLMYKNEKEYVTLTDIQGPEDHFGDMDFKVAGTKNGITAVQMDIKVSGVSLSILKEAFQKAKTARLKILETIQEELKEPRESISPNAPFIDTLIIKPEKIGLVIGPGGKHITELRERTKTDIEIEDSGKILIIGKESGVKEAKSHIEEATREYEVGQKLDGVVNTIVDFGAFIKLGPNTDGLLHISEIAPFRVDDVEKVLRVGQKIPVVIKEKDDRGRLKLSLKEADPLFIKKDSD